MHELRFLLTSHRDFALISNLLDISPRQELKDLHREDPDGYALLTEHLIVDDAAHELADVT